MELKKPYEDIYGGDINKMTKPDIVCYLNDLFQINDTLIDLVKKLRNKYIIMQNNLIESETVDPCSGRAFEL